MEQKKPFIETVSKKRTYAQITRPAEVLIDSQALAQKDEGVS